MTSSPRSFTIGTVGSGHMAGPLGRLWAARGHRVLFGSRDPDKARALAAQVGFGAEGGSQADAVAFGQVVLLATPWADTEAIVRGLPPLAGKVVIDVTNPFHPERGLLVGPETAGAERIAALAPGAHVVKAFNHIHFTVLETPVIGGQVASAFYCGDDAGAKATVRTLIEAIGFAPVDVGPLHYALYLEAMAVLWISMAFLQGMGTDFTFTLLRR